jgi:hypothetical protein
VSRASSFSSASGDSAPAGMYASSMGMSADLLPAWGRRS